MSGVDVKALKARAQAARDIVHPKPAPAGEEQPDSLAKRLGWSFTMRRPTDLALRESLAGNQSVWANQVVFQREQVFASLVAWSGPKVKDVDPSAEGELAEMPLPFDRSLCEDLFGDRPDLLDELGAVMLLAMMDRKTKREEAAKNLQATSRPSGDSQT